MTIKLSSSWIGSAPVAFLFVFSLFSIELANAYQRCSGWDDLPEKDNFCPRIEGQYPKGCCPAIQRERLTCWYYEIRRNGQLTQVNSSYTQCVNGQDVQVPCCRTAREDCFANEQGRYFTEFLTFRSDQGAGGGCCFSQCPSAAYWSDHPIEENRIDADYHRRGEQRAPRLCQAGPINRCTNGGGVCQSSNPCPRPTPPPTNPMPGTGPSPGLDPSPRPDPRDPTPRPEEPTPRPKPGRPEPPPPGLPGEG